MNRETAIKISNAASSVYMFREGLLTRLAVEDVKIVQGTPGAYTVQVSGVGGTTGVALAEIYAVP